MSIQLVFFSTIFLIQIIARVPELLSIIFHYYFKTTLLLSDLNRFLKYLNQNDHKITNDRNPV